MSIQEIQLDDSNVEKEQQTFLIGFNVHSHANTLVEISCFCGFRSFFSVLFVFFCPSFRTCRSCCRRLRRRRCRYRCCMNDVCTTADLYKKKIVLVKRKVANENDKDNENKKDGH